MTATLRSLLIPFLTFCFIFGVSIAVILYGRGYRIDIKNNTVKPTGLISASSDPIGAQVYVDGKLKTATNNSFNIDPGWYTVTISKESFIAWQKKIRVQGEIVTQAQAYLFPTNPSLSPLTTSGILNPVLSPDGTKIAYVIPVPTDTSDTSAMKKAGLWTYELTEGPLGRNRDPVQLDNTNTLVDLSTAILHWSPDSSEILVQTSGISRIYPVRNPKQFFDVTASVDTLVSDWSEQTALKEHEKLSSFPPAIISLASSSAKIVSFSPDETKLLYEATASARIPQIIKPALIGTNSSEEQRLIAPGKFYIYDMKEDKNYFLLDAKEIPTPTPTPKPARTNSMPSISQKPIQSLPVFWFPTSRHVIFVLPTKIDVIEYDRTNWATLYSGPFVNNFVAAWPNGSRLIILTSLNPGQNNLPNLYTVNLR